MDDRGFSDGIENAIVISKEIIMRDVPARRLEIDSNYDFLQRHLARILPTHEGQYALIKSCRFEGFFDKPGDAYRAGLDRFEDRLFSIQEVTNEPLHLGFFSLAGA